MRPIPVCRPVRGQPLPVSVPAKKVLVYRGHSGVRVTDSRLAHVCTHRTFLYPSLIRARHRRLQGHRRYQTLSAALVRTTERTGDGILT